MARCELGSIFQPYSNSICSWWGVIIWTLEMEQIQLFCWLNLTCQSCELNPRNRWTILKPTGFSSLICHQQIDPLFVKTYISKSIIFIFLSHYLHHKCIVKLLFILKLNGDFKLWILKYCWAFVCLEWKFGRISLIQ